MATGKMRLDQLVFKRGLAESREKARRLVMAGQVLSGTQVLNKPGKEYPEDFPLLVKESEKYVSRGGLKIESFFEGETVPPIVKGIDLGSSTGGFTDFLLQHGASEMTCVEVGQGIMHWKLRQDSRVKLFEKVNARFLDQELVGEDFDFACMDLSFISLKLVLPPLVPLLKKGAYLLALVKPQFEAGRDKVEKGGVVRDVEVQLECVQGIRKLGEESLGLLYLVHKASGLKGPKGNQEYFIYFQKV